MLTDIGILFLKNEKPHQMSTLANLPSYVNKHHTICVTCLSTNGNDKWK
jgi:hypothetical protein